MNTTMSTKPTSAFIGLSYLVLGAGMIAFCIGLWNADALIPSEKGFYGMSFLLSLFGAITVQKNTRDMDAARGGVC